MDEINTTDDLVSKPINVSLPWDEFHPSDKLAKCLCTKPWNN